LLIGLLFLATVSGHYPELAIVYGGIDPNAVRTSHVEVGERLCRREGL